MGNQSSADNTEDVFEEATLRRCCQIVAENLNFKTEEEQKNTLLTEPSDQEYSSKFNFENHVEHAKIALEIHQNLATLRHALVPGRLNEETFWRNYFYLVYLENSDPFQVPTSSAPDPFASDPFTQSGPVPSDSDPFAGGDPFASDQDTSAKVAEDPFATTEPAAVEGHEGPTRDLTPPRELGPETQSEPKKKKEEEEKEEEKRAT